MRNRLKWKFLTWILFLTSNTLLYSFEKSSLIMSHVRNAPSSQESSSSEDLIILPHNLSSLTECSVLFYSEIWLVPGGAGQVCTLNLRPCCVSRSDAFNYAPTQSFPRQPSTSHPITCFQTSFLCWAASEDLESSAANHMCVCVCVHYKCVNDDLRAKGEICTTHTHAETFILR